MDDAFEAIDNWNSSHKGEPAKTLQLDVNPGFNSPQWLYQSGPGSMPVGDYLSSCDFLFMQMNTQPNPLCGYTTIFVQTEVAPDQIGPAKLPLPWNSTYQAQWEKFLTALNNHIQSKPRISDFVSIAVAGPTASSAEIIVPNEHNQEKYKIDALSAWNCLLANSYGVNSTYLNSDRAFIEAWATAIDTFGKVFSGVTLTLATGNGLPNFNPSETTTPGCGLNGIILPDSSTPGYSKLLLPHPAFLPDCGTSPKYPMDCAAEVAILAYFAEPPVGGGNAKATQENALSASDDVVDTLLSLSNASVKWLSKNTDGLILSGPQPDPTAPISAYPEGPIGVPLVSRMLGGLQFGSAASTPGTTENVGCPYLPCGTMSDNCATTQGSTTGCYCATTQGSTTCYRLYTNTNNALANPVEQALLNALQVFFAGTSEAGAFDARGTVMNNGRSVKDAPINYLQIWEDDIQYAAGGCSVQKIMTQMCVPKTHMPYVKIGASTKQYTANDLLVLASQNIPTTPVTKATLYWYNQCPNQTRIPSCDEERGYYHRESFENDLVCVTSSEQSAAVQETDNGLSTNPKLNHYLTNATDYSVHPYYPTAVPYGLCEASYVWRQAFMGDYVCVPPQPEQADILAENSGIVYGTGIKCP